MDKEVGLNQKTGFHLGLLLIGVALVTLSQVRHGVNILGWIAPVPFLFYLLRTDGVRSRVFLCISLCIAWTLAAAKFITAPFPPMLIVINGLTFGFLSCVVYLGWSVLQRRLPPWMGHLTFPAMMVSLEWFQCTFTPLASNGSAAYTQLENLPILQFASLFGIFGISFLMYWFAAIVAGSLHHRKFFVRQSIAVTAVILTVAIYGSFRIGAPVEGKMAKVAMVGTDFDWFGEALPAQSERDHITDVLFARTRSAADAGARLIVWNEVSNIIFPAEEPHMVKRAAVIAGQYNSEVVMSFLVVLEVSPLRVENKLIRVSPDGDVADMYLKQKRVPGEPSVRGTRASPVTDSAIGRLGGAICYDFDFPGVARQLAVDGADIVYLPSSDTVGVDPFHSQIAAIRAIEGGYSVVRSTRMGLSAAIDPYGRIRGWQSANEQNDRILLATVPSESVRTLYAITGDLFCYLCLLFVVFSVGYSVYRRSIRLVETTPSSRG
jgi:apolipoprotein N-acyltransferase